MRFHGSGRNRSENTLLKKNFSKLEKWILRILRKSGIDEDLLSEFKAGEGGIFAVNAVSGIPSIKTGSNNQGFSVPETGIAALARTPDSLVRTSDTLASTSDSLVRTSDSSVRTPDYSIRTSGSLVRTPDYFTRTSDYFAKTGNPLVKTTKASPDKPEARAAMEEEHLKSSRFIGIVFGDITTSLRYMYL